MIPSYFLANIQIGSGQFISISSPEPKAQVSFSDQNVSVVVVVVVAVKFSHFNLLLQNQ